MEKKSRLLVKALRHQPDILGLNIDARGWVDVKDVIKSLEITQQMLDEIVSTNDKKRFEYNDTKTKISVTGHSITELKYSKIGKSIPRSLLYHGTADYSVGPL